MEQWGCSGEPRAQTPKWSSVFHLAQVSNIRLAEYQIEIKAADTGEVLKVPCVEIRSRYKGQRGGDARVPDTDDGSNPPPPAAPAADDKMEDAPAASTNEPAEFECDDPSQFPLAKAFSKLPDRGFEVRIRFCKPRPSKGCAWWYWPVACGLLAGLDAYKVWTSAAVTSARQAWDLAKWTRNVGTYQGLCCPPC